MDRSGLVLDWFGWGLGPGWERERDQERHRGTAHNKEPRTEKADADDWNQDRELGQWGGHGTDWERGHEQGDRQLTLKNAEEKQQHTRH